MITCIGTIFIINIFSFGESTIIIYNLRSVLGLVQSFYQLLLNT